MHLKLALLMYEAKCKQFTARGILHQRWFVLTTWSLSYIDGYSLCVGLCCSQSTSTRILVDQPLHRHCLRAVQHYWINGFWFLVRGTRQYFHCLLEHPLWAWTSWSREIRWHEVHNFSESWRIYKVRFFLHEAFQDAYQRVVTDTHCEFIPVLEPSQVCSDCVAFEFLGNLIISCFSQT